MSKRKAAVFLLAATALGFCAGWWLQKQNLIDACLDAGGRWQVHGSFCEGVAV